MGVIASNNFFEFSIQEEIAILIIKEKVFDFITDLNLSNQLIDLLESIDNDPKIKAFLFFDELNSLGDEQYDAFIKRVIEKSGKENSYEPPCYAEKNIRFREINILNKLIRRIARIQKLVFSGIQGTVVTPFIGASLVSDFRYASDDAVLSMAHNRYGLHPSGGLPFFLHHYLNHSMAMELQLKDKITAKEAYDLGLFNKLFPQKQFITKILEEIKKLTAVSNCTIRDTKRLSAFNIKELNDYFEFEASLLNL